MIVGVMNNLSKVTDIFSDILSKTTDSPDEDSYRKAKAKTNGHSKKDAAKQIQRQSSGVVSHELWYNPSRDESLSPLQRDSKRRNMEQKKKTMKEWERQRYEAGDPNAPPPNDMFRQNLKKSRFEQRATPGNFIPRPDPKKNTTEENKDETAVILAKESPKPVPGVSPPRSERSVGRGKKLGRIMESEAATPDKSTYVVGMEKADSAENVRRLKDEEQYGREYDAMYFDRTKSIKDLSLPPDDEVRDAGSDRHIYQSDKAMDRDPDITRHSSVLRRDKAKSTRAHHQGEMVHARMEGQSMNMEKMILKAFGVRKADKGKVLPFESEGDKEKRERRERLLNDLSPSHNPNLRAHFEANPQDLERYNKTLKDTLAAASSALKSVRGANAARKTARDDIAAAGKQIKTSTEAISDSKKSKPDSENPTKPRWGGEGIGQHMEKAKDNNIYAIATAAAKGDEDKKEEIVRALKRGKMLLKAFGVHVDNLG